MCEPNPVVAFSPSTTRRPPVLVKNEYDHQGLHTIGGIVARILDELCRAARPGMATADLDALARTLLDRHEAEATPRKEYGFPGDICISVNDEVVHGIPGDRILATGDLIKLDLTARHRGYVADATRMIVLDGAPDSPAARLADAARRACRAAIDNARVGMLLGDLGEIIQNEAGRSGFTIIEELCGHGVGRRTHEAPEVPNFHDKDNPGLLQSGLVIAIEPIISAGNGGIRRLGDGWTIATADGAWAAHYEETVIVWDHGLEVVTAIP